MEHSAQSLTSPAGSSVARIGLGCMGMSEFYGPADDAHSLKVLREAHERGYRHFDTADAYGAGDNERLLGCFLSELGSARNDVLIATKAGIKRLSGPTPGIRADSSPEHLLAACDASLSRLGIECIDLFYLHRRSPEIAVEESVGALASLVRAGKVRRIGLSEVSAETLRRACREHPIAALQSEYSLWSRDPEHGVLAECAALGVAFVAYSPLGRGFLTGKLDPARISGGNDLRQHLPRFQGQRFDANRSLLPPFQQLAASLGASAAQLALAWVLAQGVHIHAIPGSRNLQRISENFNALSLRLTSAQLHTLNTMFRPEAIHGARLPEHLLSTVNV